MRLTPAGRGGVTTLLLTGSKAVDLFSLRFIPQSKMTHLSYLPAYPYFGKLRLDETDQFEEIVSRIIDSNNVEIHCHGGDMIFHVIAQSFASDGVQIKNCIESTSTAISTDTSNNSQRELALRLLPFAATKRTAQILIDQYHGAMENVSAEINKLSVSIDMIDHNIAIENNDSKVDCKIQTDLLRNQYQNQLNELRNRIEENKLTGQHLVKPFRVVLTGETNVGKSSIFNAILGYNRTIISPVHGTTRDVIAAQTAIDGFPVTIYDTAGIRNNISNEIENEGINRSIKQIEEADLVIYVIDLTTDLTTNRNKAMSEIIVSKNVLTCYNKSDLTTLTTDLPDGICISAKTGAGISELIEKIARILIPKPPSPFEAVPLVWNI
jgi:tRNA modification GTPase